MINKNEWLTVGLITSCHGINGQVKVKSLSDFEERFLKPGLRWLQKENEPPSKIELISGFKQPGKESFIVKLQGINTRNHAEQLKKFKILVKTDKLPKLKKEEFHLLELINLSIKTLAAFVSACLWDLPNADDSLYPSINISQENLLGSPFFFDTSIIL